MKFNGVEVPASGQKITLSGKDLVVPNNPIIPFIEGDGTGRDIWNDQILPAQGYLLPRSGHLNSVKLHSSSY